MKKVINILEGACTSLGKNNKSTYPVMAIAFVKGIFRPAFTMMDQTEEPETKKYTALREGLTELIAIPTYFFCGEGAAAISKLFPKKLQTNANTNLMFFGVCTAALIAIPALCSVAIKPLMDKIQHKNSKNNEFQPQMNLNITDKVKEHSNIRYNNYDRLNTFSSKIPDNYRLNCRIGGL